MGLAHSPSIVTNGLVLCLDAANRKSYPGSGTTWTDLSGNNNTGTLTNGPTFNSSNQGSVVLDGTNDYITLGNILNFTTENFTINTFFYLNSLTTSTVDQGPVIFYKGAYTSKGYYFQVRLDGSGFFVTSQSGAFQGTQTTTGYFTTGNWYDITVTRSGSSAIIYSNAINANSTSGTHTNPTSSSENFLLGAYTHAFDPSPIINGNIRISNFKVYNRALSANEVLQNYNALRGRFGL